MTLDEQLFLRSTIDNLAPLRSLRPADKEILSDSARVRRFSKRHLLHSRNDVPNSVYIVMHGSIELTATTINGVEAVLAILGKGSFVTWLGAFSDAPIERDWYANDNAVLFEIPRKILRQVFANNPSSYLDIIKEIEVRYRALMTIYLSHMRETREQRISKLLAGMARMNNDYSDQPELNISHEKLAKLAFCSRQTLTSSLKKLEKEGRITQSYRKIKVLRNFDK